MYVLYVWKFYMYIYLLTYIGIYLIILMCLRDCFGSKEHAK